jgi:predicted ATPase
MLGLKLRDEFLGSNMPGTAIQLRTKDEKGAVQKIPGYILSITYPTTDVKIALKTISSPQLGRPVTLMGERGRGKSHIMALMHHAIASPEAVETWLADWAGRGKPELAEIKFLRGYFPISEAVHDYEYSFLWDLLFDRHQNGAYYKGQFEGMNQPIPPRSLLERMFSDQKVCLILDEFQTWYDSLPVEKMASR